MRQQSARWRQKGFSLIEGLIVVTIILLVSAMAIPNIAAYIRTYRIQGAVRELSAEIQTARTTAIMKNVTWGVVIYAASPTTYQLVVEDNQDRSGANSRRQMTVPLAIAAGPIQAGPMRALPDGVAFSARCGVAPNAVGLRFNRLGMLCGPGVDAGCAALGVGVPAIQVGGGVARICLEDAGRRLARRVNLTSGGRVRVEVIPW